MLESGDFLTADKKPFGGSKKVVSSVPLLNFKPMILWNYLYVWRLTFNRFKCGFVIICPSSLFFLLFCTVVLQDTTWRLMKDQLNSRL